MWALLHQLCVKRVVFFGSQVKNVSGRKGVIRVMHHADRLSKMNNRNEMDFATWWATGPLVILITVDLLGQKLNWRSLKRD